MGQGERRKERGKVDVERWGGRERERGGRLLGGVGGWMGGQGSRKGRIGGGESRGGREGGGQNDKVVGNE